MNELKTASDAYAEIIEQLITNRERPPETLTDKITNVQTQLLNGQQAVIENAVIFEPDSFTPGVAPVQILQEVGGVASTPFETNILAYIPMSVAERSYIHTVDESARVGGAATRAENAPIQQGDRTYTEVTYKATHISTYVNVSLESLEDATFLRNELSTSLRAEALNELANQVINGDGNAPNMNGLFNIATTFAAGAFANNVVTPTYNDVLKVAQNMILQENHAPTVAAVNPQDFTTMQLGFNAMTDFDFTVVPTTHVPVDKYLLFDANVTRLYIVTDQLVFSEQNQDNAINNVISVIYNSSSIFRVSSVHYPAIVKGTFSTDLAAITAP